MSTKGSAPDCAVTYGILTKLFKNLLITLGRPKNKKALTFIRALVFIVGVAGFEPAASTSQMWRDTGLRYTPSGLQK